jgi:hypothetical protein
MVAIIKQQAAEGDAPDMRPIGMGCTRHRVWARVLIGEQRDMLRKSMWPVQVACGVGGGTEALLRGIDAP